MDEFHKHTVEWKKPDGQGYGAWSPIYIQYKTYWNKPTLSQVKKMVILAEGSGTGLLREDCSCPFLKISVGPTGVFILWKSIELFH